MATWINAPVERCFLLSLSIDLQVDSARSAQEKAIGGTTTGLIAEGESVTFQGRRFGVRLRHTSRVVELRPYSYFREVMIAGAFLRFEHEHYFTLMDDGTRLKEEIRFSLPWGPLGQLATKLFVRRRLRRFLADRNALVKRVAESDEWRKYLETWVEGRAAAPAKNEAGGYWDRNELLRGSEGL